jgi:hypothetical protein
MLTYYQQSVNSARGKRGMNERGIPMTYKTGSIGEFMRWTKRVIANPPVASHAPKRWFDSKETATKVLGQSGRKRS